ncbi:MAG TPA: rod shape-determining protein RodA [Solirubrobacteraceae bacterium]|nr:rod shape-determining protein RodA [Solirubrobacteraceae bacterium]
MSTHLQRANADTSEIRPRAIFLFDPLLALAALGLVAFSIMTLHSAFGSSFSDRQAAYAGVGTIIAVVLARIDYSRLREYRYGLYAVLIASNLAVFAFASSTLGAKRRIPFPFIEVQPSELAKILLIVSLSAFAVDRVRRLHERQTTGRIMLLALGPALLVIAQPDLGTGMVFVAIAIMMLLVAGTSWKQLTALAALFVTAIVMVLIVAPSLGVHVLNSYQEQRLTGFLHPSANPQSQTYQINQSIIAIGSGQKTGTGVANATQTTLGYLPEPQTDFIFAVVGEGYGFAGAALVLLLYALLIWRALRILTMAKNLFGALIAAGILGMLMFQVFVNVGMTIGIMPITGVPLPLMSYGGSSVLVTFIALGLLQSIHIQARIASAGKGRALLS